MTVFTDKLGASVYGFAHSIPNYVGLLALARAGGIYMRACLCRLPNSGSIEVLRRGYLVIYIGCGTPV